MDTTTFFSLYLVQTLLPAVAFNGPLWMQINLYCSQITLKHNFSKQLGKSLYVPINSQRC